MAWYCRAMFRDHAAVNDRRGVHQASVGSDEIAGRPDEWLPDRVLPDGLADAAVYDAARDDEPASTHHDAVLQHNGDTAGHDEMLAAAECRGGGGFPTDLLAVRVAVRNTPKNAQDALGRFWKVLRVFREESASTHAPGVFYAGFASWWPLLVSFLCMGWSLAPSYATAAVSFLPPSATQMRAPANVSCPVAGTEVVVSWDRVAGAFAYQVEAVGLLDDGTIIATSDFVFTPPGTIVLDDFATLTVHVRALALTQQHGGPLASAIPKGLWSEVCGVELTPVR